MSRDRFLVAPSSYTKIVKAEYRLRIYLYLVRFSGMSHYWLQRYRARVRTLGSPLVHCRGIHCTKYERPRSNNGKEVQVTIRITYLNKYDLYILLQCHIGDLNPYMSIAYHKQLVCQI